MSPVRLRLSPAKGRGGSVGRAGVRLGRPNGTDGHEGAAWDGQKVSLRSRLLGLGVWSGLVSVGVVWGRQLVEARPEIHVGAAPLVGSWRVPADWGLPALPALAVAGLAVAFGPWASRLLRWRHLVLVVMAAAVVWAVTLALVDGPGALTAPLATRYDYLQAVPLVGSPGAWLDGGFLDQIDTLPTHVQSHPPGMVLVLWALDRIGLGGAGPAAALVIAGGAAAVAAVVVALREVAGEASARKAAPYLALAPFFVWVATSADALFAGVSAWGATLILLGVRAKAGSASSLGTNERSGMVASADKASGASSFLLRGKRRSDLVAVAGGVLCGVAAYLSYGLVLVALVPLAVAVHRRQLRPLVLAACGGLAVVAVFTGAGFWWVEGLARTRLKYAHGLSEIRPYSYFVVGNLAALALALGPVAAVALAHAGARTRAHVRFHLHFRRAGLWLLVSAAALAVLVADISGLAKGEVERVWLPFMPWLLAVTAALPASHLRRWLALHAAAGLGLQVLVRSPW